MNVFGIALSGMNAAQTRLGTSANNVANLQSTSSNINGQVVDSPYQPKEVNQRSIEPTGGVGTSLRTRDPATVPIYKPDSPEADDKGIVEYPNVNLEEEIIEQKFASYDFKANARVIKAQDEMMESLLDIKA